MTEPKPINSGNTEQPDPTMAGLLEVRRFARGLAIATERLLETMGHPVDNPTKPDRERNGLTKSKR